MAIRRLSPAVASRIAAGEVVERPASVVKELAENAIDAGARRIAVELEGGGIELIRVTDDGGGIAPDDLPLAFDRHATSKLRSDADLERIETLGFRGEALPSIAAVADVDCVSRVADEPHAWRLRLRGGRADPPEPATRSPGTTMAVRELFAETPARRKFLRGRAGEAGQVAGLLSQLALAYPEIAVSLSIDGRRTLETPGDGDLVSAIGAVHGRAAAEHAVPIEPEQTASSAVVVGGCLGTAEATLPTRAGITLLVNRRCIQHRALSYALDDAYRTLVPVGRHPIAVLDLRLPPADVDVNVHPRKTEVRLVRERAVFAAVQRAVHRTLGAAAGPRGATIFESDDPDAGSGEEEWLGGLRVLGQANATYIIAEGSAGLYLVDQHAAHERVLYEALRESWRTRRETQALLEPALLELTPREAVVVRDHLDELRAVGYEADLFGERTLLVRTVAAALTAGDPLQTLRNALSALADDAVPTDWRDRLAILLACHNAVRAGDRLSPEEMHALLAQLGEADLCQACSHGRPTALLISLTQLAREFCRPT